MDILLTLSVILNIFLYYHLGKTLKANVSIVDAQQCIIDMNMAHIKRISEINTLLNLRHQALQNEQYEDIAGIERQLQGLIDEL